jgi:hypothetical protein
MKKYILILLITCATILQAQTVKTVRAEIVYYVPETESRKEALVKAIEEARTEAMRRAFGESVTATSGHVNEKMTIYGNTEVNGKWLEDTKKPVVRYRIDSISGETGIFVKVCGKAQEIKRQETELKIAAKRCTDKGQCNVTTSFKNGDLLNIDFMSPKAGFLAVYLQDEDNNIFRLLPSVLNTKGIQEIRAYTNYESMFNQIKNNYIELITFKSVEFNQLHFIFSPNKFTIPLDEEMESGLRWLDYKKYQEWLSKNRTRDAEMQVHSIQLEIRQ